MFTNQLRGQLGLPYKQFGELKSNLDKLKINFDLIVQGHISMQDLDMAQAEDCQLLQGSDKGRISEQCLNKPSVASVLDQDYDEDILDDTGMD